MFISVFMYFAVAVAGHAVLCRTRFVGNIVTKFLAVGGLLGVALIGHNVFVQGLGVETWPAVLAYGFGCELYIFLFTLVGSSVSASLLLTLGTGTLPQTEIDKLYSNTYMVERRIDNLLAAGLLGVTRSGYLVTAKGQSLLAVFRTLHRFFKHAKPPN